MDKFTTNEVKGDKMDDKSCVTGFCGGARTGEAAEIQHLQRYALYTIYIVFVCKRCKKLLNLITTNG